MVGVFVLIVESRKMTDQTRWGIDLVITKNKAMEEEQRKEDEMWAEESAREEAEEEKAIREAEDGDPEAEWEAGEEERQIQAYEDKLEQQQIDDEIDRMESGEPD